MKNYKHVSNSNNAMKLAAVASAAIMLAPVALNSFSTFATGMFTANDSQGNPRQVFYPEYLKFATVDSAVAANQNGTNGQNNSGSQEGATVGFNLTDLQNVLNQIAALTINPNSGKYQSQKDELTKQYNKLYYLAKDAQDSLTAHATDDTSAFRQLSPDNQTAALQGLTDAGTQFNAVAKDAETAIVALQKADDDAVSATNDANAKPADVARLAAVANAAASNAKTAMGKFQSYVDLVGSYNQIVGRKTNNGSVYEAAQAAGLAISKVPTGADRDALTASLSQIQATYALVTKLDVSNSTDNAKAIDAAAAKAVADLNDLAGKAFKLAPASSTTNGQIGTVKVNYNKNYGIQIWTAGGKAVRFNKEEAKTTLLFGKPVKTGDAKKLQGQKNFKVFAVNGKNTVNMNGTTYYNLGGDQYIDAAYVTLNAAK